MDSILVPVSGTRTTRSPASLRRSMPAPADGSRLQTALLALLGLAVFVDIEFTLAYLLYLAMQVAR